MQNWMLMLSLTSCHRNLYNSCSKKKSVCFYTGDLGSVTILQKHLALLMKNLCFKYKVMHALWNCARIWRKIKVEQLISYMSVFSKKTWNQAVKTRNLAMPSSAKDCANSNTPTVQRDRDILIHGFYQLSYSYVLTEHKGSIFGIANHTYALFLYFSELLFCHFIFIIFSLQAQYKLEKNVCILTKQVRSSKKAGIICAIKMCKKADKDSDSSVL